jgi:hypothetical protein
MQPKNASVYTRRVGAYTRKVAYLLGRRRLKGRHCVRRKYTGCARMCVQGRACSQKYKWSRSSKVDDACGVERDKEQTRFFKDTILRQHVIVLQGDRSPAIVLSSWILTL